MKRIAVVAIAAGAACSLFALPAHAEVAATGWWTRNPVASAPEGGMQVAVAPDGVVSFGGVQAAEPGDSIESATLSLKESGSPVNSAAITLEACPAAGTFKSGKGTLADAPKADCEAGRVPLERDPSGVWSADVTSVLSGDTPALAVVPAAGATTFQVEFEPPTLDVVVSSSSGGVSDSSTADLAEFAEFDGSDASSASDSSSSGGEYDSSAFAMGDLSTGGATFSPEPLPSSPVEAATPMQPAAPVDVAATAADESANGSPAPSALLSRTAATTPTAGGNRALQFLFFVVTAGVIGTAAGFGRNRLTARGVV